MFTVTDSAAKKINELLVDKEGALLRLGAEAGGCSGYSYYMDIVDEVFSDDTTFDVNGIKLVIDNSELDVLKGSKIDYIDDVLESRFVIDNPNAVGGGCGCGKSFSTDDGTEGSSCGGCGSH